MKCTKYPRWQTAAILKTIKSPSNDRHAAVNFAMPAYILKVTILPNKTAKIILKYYKWLRFLFM